MEPELRLGHDPGECTDVCSGVAENSITRAVDVSAAVIVRALPSIAVSFLADMNVLLVLVLSGPGPGFFGCRASTCCGLCGHCLAELAGKKG